MKFMADENFPRQAVAALRNAGFDVAWITEEAPSIATMCVSWTFHDA